MGLNEEQKNAVEKELPLIVTAGAGSGKTKVLVERYESLLISDYKNLKKIVAFTYTVKAAEEMFTRVRTTVVGLIKAGKLEKSVATVLEAAPISTIHSFCASLLRTYPLESEVSPDFEILDEVRKNVILSTIVKSVKRKHATTITLLLGEAGGLKGTTLDSIIRKLVDMGGLYGKRKKDDFERWEEETAKALIDTFNRAGAENSENWRRIRKQFYLLSAYVAEEFESYKMGEASRELDEPKTQYLSYEDLLQKAIYLLTSNADIREKVQKSVSYLLVDEGQDLNHPQAEIISLLVENRTDGRRPLFIVGDKKQAIFGFQGGNAEIFERYEGVFDKVALAKNYRSRKEILTFANCVFEKLWKERDNKASLFQKLEAGGTNESASEEPVERANIELWVFAEQSTGDVRNKFEALQIAEIIENLIAIEKTDEGKKEVLRETAVLAKNNAHLLPVSVELKRRNIPYRLLSSENLLTLMPTQIVLDFLRIVVNPLNDIQLLNVLRSPFAGISKKAVACFSLRRMSAGKTRRTPIWNLISSPKELAGLELTKSDEARVKEFVSKYNQLLPLASRLHPAQFLNRVADTFVLRASFEVAYQNEPSVSSLFDDLYLFFLQLAPSESGISLHRLLDTVELAMVYGIPEAGESFASSARIPAVTLSTVHKAKGLEWDTVILARSAFRNQSRADDFSQKFGIKAQLDASEYLFEEKLKDELQKQEQAQLENLLYVALTRPKKKLIITGMVPQKPTQKVGTFAGYRDRLLDSYKFSCFSNYIFYSLSELAEDYYNKVSNQPKEAQKEFIWEPRTVITVKTGQGESVAVTIKPISKELKEAKKSLEAFKPLKAGGLLHDIPWYQPPVDSIAVTSLLTYMRCPKRYSIIRAGGGKFVPSRFAPDEAEEQGAEPNEFEVDSADAKKFGSLFHELMDRADFSNDKERELKRLCSLAHPVAEEMGFDLDDTTEFEEHLRNTLFDEKLSAVVDKTEIEKEYPFYWLKKVAGRTRQTAISGVIDLLARKPDGALTIIDYKTNKKLPDKDQQLEYEEQIKIYALSLFCKYGAVSIEGALYYSTLGEFHPVALDKKSLSDFEKKLDEALSKFLLATDFPPIPGDHCAHCSAKDKCR